MRARRAARSSASRAARRAPLAHVADHDLDRGLAVVVEGRGRDHDIDLAAVETQDPLLERRHVAEPRLHRGDARLNLGMEVGMDEIERRTSDHLPVVAGAEQLQAAFVDLDDAAVAVDPDRIRRQLDQLSQAFVALAHARLLAPAARGLLGQRLRLLLQLADAAVALCLVLEAEEALGRDHDGMPVAEVAEEARVRLAAEQADGIGAAERERPLRPQPVPEILEALGLLEHALRGEQGRDAAEHPHCGTAGRGGGEQVVEQLQRRGFEGLLVGVAALERVVHVEQPQLATLAQRPRIEAARQQRLGQRQRELRGHDRDAGLAAFEAFGEPIAESRAQECLAFEELQEVGIRGAAPGRGARGRGAHCGAARCGRMVIRRAPARCDFLNTHPGISSRSHPWRHSDRSCRRDVGRPVTLRSGAAAAGLGGNA